MSNKYRKPPSEREGERVLTEHPEIRKFIRFRSDRWELRGTLCVCVPPTRRELPMSDECWTVHRRSCARYRLWWRGFGLVKRQAEGVMLVLEREGAGLDSDGPNPGWLGHPEFWMPLVRKFFRYRGHICYERDSTRWRPVGQDPHDRIFERMRAEFHGALGWPLIETCLYELKIKDGR